MKYDFETLVSRKNTGSMKWDLMYSAKPTLPDGVVPFSIADMELKNAPEIIDGLKKYLDTSILGYTGPTDGYYDAVIGWTRSRHGYDVKKEEILTSPGVIPAFVKAAGALTKPGDAVMFLTPAYPPFWSAGKSNGIDTVEVPLINTGVGYELDVGEFRRAAERPEVKVFIFCNPHNPVGKVWSRADMETMMEICLENSVTVIADEIHSDLIMPSAVHVSVGVLDEKYRNNCVICTAPSKTFNLAGMQTSNIIVPSPELRERISCVNTTLTALGYEACRLAYTHCGEWLDELNAFLYENYLFAKSYLEKNLPMAKVYPLEGTYLMWIDLNGLGKTPEELEKVHIENDLFLDEGYIFGELGRGFERINIACPRGVLAEALERLASAWA